MTQMKQENLIIKNFTIYDEMCDAYKYRQAKKLTDTKKLGGNVLTIGKCPTCGGGCNSEMNYCDHCGQKLDWSGR